MLPMNKILLKAIHIVLLFGVTGLYAQIKVDVKASDKHTKIIKSVNETRHIAEQRKAQADRLKEHIKARQKYAQVYDSLKATQEKEFSRLKGNYEDSLLLSEKVLSDVNFPPEYKRYILLPEEYKKYVKEDLSGKGLKHGQGYAEEQARSILPEELNQSDLSNSLNAAPLDQNTNTVLNKTKKLNPNIISPETAQTLFKKVDLHQFQNAKTTIQNLKKEYATLPDTRYPSEATKRNSLEKASFDTRIFYGGSINLRSTDPVILDIQLQLGYWINKNWLAGVSGILREQLNEKDSSLLTGDAHGYSFFTRYNIGKGFFTWLEVERQLNKSIFPQNELNSNPTWQQTCLFGLGREYQIGPVQMMSMILYDLNYKKNNLYARPIVFKIGFRLSKNPTDS